MPNELVGDRGAGDLARDVRELFTLEFEMAKTELTGELRRAGAAAVLLSSAAVVGTLGLATLPVALAKAAPTAKDVLAVGMGLMLVSGALALFGVKKLAAVDPVPHRTLRSFRGLRDEVASSTGADAGV